MLRFSHQQKRIAEWLLITIVRRTIWKHPSLTWPSPCRPCLRWLRWRRICKCQLSMMLPPAELALALCAGPAEQHENIHLWYDLCTAADGWDDWGGDGDGTLYHENWRLGWLLVGSLLTTVTRPTWKHPSLTWGRCFQQVQDSPLGWAILTTR